MDEILPFVTETPHNLMAAAEGKIFAFIFLTRHDE